MRYAKLELENTQSNEGTTAGVFGTPFFLPATEVGLVPNPQPLDRSDEQRGVDGRLQQAENEYEPEGAITIRGYASYLGALLYILFGDVVTTAGNGVITDPDGNVIPAGATRHVFAKKPGATPKSARITAAYGDSWIQGRGVTIPELGFSLDEDGMKGNASLMANFVSRLTADPGDTPDYEDFSILPFRRRNVTVDLDNGGTKNIESIEWTMEQSLEYVRDLGTATGFPTDTERENSFEGFLGLAGTVTRRDFDDADWDALIRATVFGLTIKAESEQNIGATNYPYAMWVEAPGAQIIGGENEALKNQARHQHELNWQAGYDESAAYDFRVTVVNATPAYE